MPRLKAPQRRQQILDVATKVFAKYGYDGATTALIARAAKVSEPILYRHFKNKKDLFTAITREMSQKTLRDWESATAGLTDPADKIRAIAQAFPTHMMQLANAYRVIHNALTTTRDRKVLAVLQAHYELIESFFENIIKEGQKSGVFGKMNSKVPTWQLIHIGIGYAMIGLNIKTWEGYHVEEAVEFILRGMRGDSCGAKND